MHMTVMGQNSILLEEAGFILSRKIQEIPTAAFMAVDVFKSR